MRIKISEVWNGGSDGSKELTVIETPGNAIQAVKSVRNWIVNNRPGLSICQSINGHGYHAIEVN